MTDESKIMTTKYCSYI